MNKQRIQKFAICTILLAASFLCLNPNAYAVLTYEGFLETPDGIDGTGDWANDFKISWLVEQLADLSWKYTYTLTTSSLPAEEIATSHLTLEISPDATANDFSDFNGSPLEFGLIDNTRFGGPGALTAVKLDYESGMYMFISEKGPVWGDFFVKGGRAGNGYNGINGNGNDRPFNTAWNTDFLDPDPTAPLQNGLLLDEAGRPIYKLLRPDSSETVIPEPASLLLMGLGLVVGTPLIRRTKII